MPLIYENGLNPYTHNYFAQLAIGTGQARPNIVKRAQDLKQKLAAGKEIVLSGAKLDEHSIAQAEKGLLTAHGLAQELLLAHSQPTDERKQLKQINQQLLQMDAMLPSTSPLPLLTPLSTFWFIDQPGIEAAEFPAWADFHLVEPGEPEDLHADIIFDL